MSITNMRLEVMQFLEKNVDTLGNASINNDGAVPEPHEWALIFIAGTTLFLYYRKSKKQSN